MRTRAIPRRTVLRGLLAWSSGAHGLVTPEGRMQKPRVSPALPLADCLRKVMVKLEFPPAARAAQHNFIYRHPDSL